MSNQTLGPLPPLIEGDAIFSDVEITNGFTPLNIDVTNAPFTQVSATPVVSSASTFGGYTLVQVVSALVQCGLLQNQA